jgi:hypothetical protein
MDLGKVFRDAWGLFTKDVGPLMVGMIIACIIPAVAVTVVMAITIGASISGFQTNAQGDVTSVDTSSWIALSIGTVVVVLVSIFLTVPLFAGLLEGVLRRVREGREMAYGDAFSGFRIFGRVVWASVLVGIILGLIMLVPVAIIVVGAVTQVWVVLALGIVLELVAIVAYIYLGISWVYVFPAIVDRGIGVSEALPESRSLVRGSGWWWTFLILFVLWVVVGAVSSVLGFIPFVGAIATILLYPFVLTYVVAMYFQARGEGELIDAVTGYRPVVPGVPAYSQGATPYAPPAAPPMPPAAQQAPPAPPAAAPPLTGGQGYAPAPPPLATPSAPDAAVQAPAAPPAPPAVPEPPAAPEPPAGA